MIVTRPSDDQVHEAEQIRGSIRDITDDVEEGR